MGMNAEVIAIGPFKKHLAKHLDYDASWYDDVPEGTSVITSLFHCTTAEASRDLAKALFGHGPWDIQYHCFDNGKVKLFDLSELCERLSIPENYESFIVLKEHGFKFWFRPNG
jgi:hypothetical protein